MTCDYEGMYLSYELSQRHDEKALYLDVIEGGDDAIASTWVKISSDGEMTEETVLTEKSGMAFAFGGQGDAVVHLYYDAQGNEISESSFEAWFTEFDKNSDIVINPWAHENVLATTYDEAIAFLEKSITEEMVSTGRESTTSSARNVETTSVMVDISNLPSSLSDFINQFQAFYNINSNGMEFNYLTASEDGTNILSEILGSMDASCVNYSLYPGDKTEEYHDSAYDGFFSDIQWYYSWYEVFDGNRVDWIAKNIFNISDDDIQILAKNGQKEKAFLVENAGESNYRYIVPKMGIGDPFCLARIAAAEYDGEKYYVTYDIYNVTDYTDESTYSYRDTYYAVFELKEIDGEEYWSLYYNSEHGFPS